ncbi:MAG: HNH endonuclease signature motif containing protein [Rhodospirillales bacterium]
MKDGHRNYVWGQIQRDRAWAEQGGKCLYCKWPMGRFEATREHRKPKCRGGTDDDSNIGASHKDCNLAKGDMPEHVFKRQLNGNMDTESYYVMRVRTYLRLARRVERAVKRIRESVT